MLNAIAATATMSEPGAWVPSQHMLAGAACGANALT